MVFTIKSNSFDSEILGLRTARVILSDDFLDSLPLAKLSQAISKMKSEIEDKYEYAVIRHPTEHFHLTHALEQAGFRLVDITVQLKLSLHSQTNINVGHEVRTATKDDLKKVEKVAHGIFVHSRFFNDPLIKNEDAHKIYVTWARNCVLKTVCDETFVFEKDGNLCGFVGIKKNGHVSLIGVSAESQGLGVGKQLVHAALKQFASWGLEEAILETQATNIPAIKLYQSCGYKMNRSFTTLRWAK